MSTSTASHIPAKTRPELIEAMRDDLNYDQMRLRLLVDDLAAAGADSNLLAEVVRSARVFGMSQRMLDLVEDGCLIADADDIDRCWYGVDAVLEFGVNDGGAR